MTFITLDGQGSPVPCEVGPVDLPGIVAYIPESQPGTRSVEAGGDYYFVHDPEDDLPEHWSPWATIVTSDAHDTASDLDRPGVYRLNVGLPKERFRELFPTDATPDHAALDTVAPHPVYGRQYWVSVLNPDTTWPTVARFLREAHERAARRYENARRRSDRKPP